MLIKYIKDRLQGKAPSGAKRSHLWPGIRKAHLAKFPACAVCGSVRKVEVHHMTPFHVEPSLELDPSNLISLCEQKKFGITCHLLVGHCGNYRGMNPDVKADAETWAKKLASRWKPEPKQVEPLKPEA